MLFRSAQRIESEYDKDRRANSGEGSKIPFYYLKKGKTLLRVLPAYNHEGIWFKEFYEHKLALGGKFVSLTCGRQYGQECALCQKGEELSLAGDETFHDFQPKRTYLFNVIVLSDPSGITAKEGVRVLKAGVTVKKELVDLDRAFSEGYGDITNAENGFTLSVERTGDTKKDTRYNVKAFRDRTNIEDVLKAQNVDFTHFVQFNLNDVVPSPRPLDEVKAAVEGRNRVPGFPSVTISPTSATPVVVVGTMLAPANPMISMEPVAAPVIPEPPK